MFKNTRLLGLKIPFHVNFEEVNLRFYVTHKDREQLKRGVVFIKEIVPRRALTFVANTIYQEHYQTLRMNHHWEQHQDELTTRYSWKTRRGWNHMNITSGRSQEAIAQGSEAEFITEHYWGYTLVDTKTTFEYQVSHPRWQQFPVVGYDIDVDFKDTYGQDFEFLRLLTPTSVMLAVGSPITVEKRKRLVF
jgi:uncharacterized protein YqjF (DUF2071 family)